MTRVGDRVLPPASQRVVPVFSHIAEQVGRPIPSGALVLDFGAGAGRHVAEFREAGFDAWGVDQTFESHEPGSVEPEYLQKVCPPRYELPFPDDYFAFVYSTSVMEHVLDPTTALSEIARVLRPGGISIHVFPSRWRPIEPHMLVPFGGRFQSFALMRVWAALGLRNGFQRDLDPTDVALRNTQYAKTGINYPTAREWDLRARPYFDGVRWSETHFVAATRSTSRVSGFVAPVIGLPGMARLYRALHTRVLVLEGS